MFNFKSKFLPLITCFLLLLVYSSCNKNEDLGTILDSPSSNLEQIDFNEEQTSLIIALSKDDDYLLLLRNQLQLKLRAYSQKELMSEEEKNNIYLLLDNPDIITDKDIDELVHYFGAETREELEADILAIQELSLKIANKYPQLKQIEEFKQAAFMSKVNKNIDRKVLSEKVFNVDYLTLQPLENLEKDFEEVSLWISCPTLRAVPDPNCNNLDPTLCARIYSNCTLKAARETQSEIINQCGGTAFTIFGASTATGSAILPGLGTAIGALVGWIASGEFGLICADNALWDLYNIDCPACELKYDSCCQ